MADTGCQSCLASSKMIHELGLNKHHLIPVTMKMTAADNHSINIIGALVLHITDKLFLSKQACVALGMIPKTFPTIGETQNLCDTKVESCSDSSVAPPCTCSCPLRQPPPPPPTALPFPAVEVNREKLGKWLLEFYKSSTFNVCKHQQLPMMSGPPMRLLVDPNAKPVAYYTAIPIPVHWQDDVKACLDQDVQLIVIEPTPIDTPVTWCHRIVVCAKKSGKPRRTVDFQALNRHALRETHHTKSPFHQARMVSHTIEKAFFQAVEWLDVCGHNGITLNPSKFSFAKTTVEFAGFEITPTSVHPCPHYLKNSTHHH
ncbi:hypothetical protein Pcinc_011499 [Petrolisthes cinctipes]|uniref:Reverse transcriptase n=1 Tax=Petrolisthes cinctipes TaxID=88211 RepID=A0AAE1G6Q9_PETCI|nr:hypothetical protein Pcinc_019915 [Petrolisthes cinctipes]KAK3884212.1 hypothetical protein Pcinc_011488 [Petrolisthes cinctipes]KAK3884223.1 hypothetical protein Pcinc_011499 [Petrolisthes cinctipes]